jgi:hypothetical protein
MPRQTEQQTSAAAEGACAESPLGRYCYDASILLVQVP